MKTILLLLLSLSVCCFGQSNCVLTSSNDLLGFDIRYQPVYQNQCSGSCTRLSRCSPNLYKYVSLVRGPPWYTVPKYRTTLLEKIEVPYVRVTAKIVAGCSCQPLGCTVAGRTYNHGQTVYNDCGDRCKCLFGQLMNCCRSRKSFAHMSTTERLRYTTAVNSIATNTGVAASIPGLHASYVALVDLHASSASIHTINTLLPWHRWYILQLEELLRKIDCRITVPYWAWELDSVSPWTSNIWSPVNGLGQGSGAMCVPNGPFQLPFTLTPTAGSGCLRRVRSGSVPTPAAVASLLATPAVSYASFFGLINGMHGSVHCAIGGTMCDITRASNAPEFFMHHGNMDRLWDKWQKQSTSHLFAFSASVNVTMSNGLPPFSLLDSSNLLGTCVEYAPVRNFIVDFIDVLSLLPREVLETLPTAAPNLLPAAQRWFEDMKKMNDSKLALSALAELEAYPPLVTYDDLTPYLGLSRYDLNDVSSSFCSDQNSCKIDSDLQRLLMDDNAKNDFS